MKNNNWTFEDISREDFYKNQHNNTLSFWKCPCCEEETLDLENRVCECWYRLDHDIPYVINKTKEKNEKIVNYKICICWNKMWINSIMCKECYWKNKLNWNI